MTNEILPLPRRTGASGVGLWFRQALHFVALVALVALVAASLTGAARAQNATFKDEEIDQMLAPIALYPDSLLSQVLMASTYPVDVKSAAAWSKAHPDAKGDEAVKQVQNEPWEPSVQSLVAFPQVLAMMDGKPDDVQRLGDAFLADPGRVMDRVQFLRKKAQEAGNLKSTEQQKVSQQTDSGKQVIVIEPAQPQAVYVPVYQPTVYGPWWYPSYPPYYWPPPPYYYPGAAFVGGVLWGAAIVGISNSLWGGFHWGGNDVNINVNRYNNINTNRQINANQNNFQHNAERRGDVPYRDSKSREQFGNKQAAGAKDREAYRGKDSRDADRARAEQTLKERGADPAAGRQQLQGADRDRAADAARASDRSGRDGASGAGDRAATRDGGAGADRAATRDGGGFGGDGGGGAFGDVRDPGASRAAADRGASSTQSMARQGGGGAAPARSASPTPSRSASPSPSRAPSAAPRGGGGGGGRGGGGRR